ncbi:unnamed protein product [Closterium sp. NIES-64]|nr:unnamed protein product [Closterium sp. NIES-64]
MTGRLLVLSSRQLPSQTIPPFSPALRLPSPSSSPPLPPPPARPVPSPPAPSPLSALQPGTLEPSSPVPFPPRSPFPSPPPFLPPAWQLWIWQLEAERPLPHFRRNPSTRLFFPSPTFSAFPPFPSPCSHPPPPSPLSPPPSTPPSPLPPPLPSSLPPPLPLPPTPPFPAWQLWSRASRGRSWGGSLAAVEPSIHVGLHGGKVPGIGASVGANVKIPCGRAVLLDVPRVSLGLLVVKGWLRWAVRWIFHGMPGGASTLAWVRLARRANKGARQITVDADVSAWPRGGVIAVASTTPDLNNAEKAIITGCEESRPVHQCNISLPPSEALAQLGEAYLRRVGPSSSIISLYRPLKHSHDGKRHAVRDGFGVVRPSTVRRVGPSSTCKCWDGERHFSYFLLPLPVPLTVRRVGPSSSIISLYRPLKHSHDGERNAVRDGKTGPSSSIISLYRPLKHSHDGEKNAVRDGFGGTVDVRAEVALLTRNIVIQGVHEQPPYQYDGGHFMVYMTRTPQTIHGVQFKGLGMQGSLGNDALWYSTQKGALLTALSHSAFESTQKGALLTALSYSHPLAYRCIVVHATSRVTKADNRCIVVHATSRVTIADNVAYETRGHCFVLEEGSEARNTFIRNLGMSTRAVHQLIPPASLAKLDRQTDDKPSTFWLATPFNSFVGNVAAGSEDSGFWMELNKHMRGLSKNLPYWKKLSPMTLAFGVFTANVLHSNALFGLRTYPHGARPMFPSRGKGRESIQVRISHSLIYSNPIGVFLYNSQSITDGHSTFVNTHIPFLSYFPRLPTTHHPPSPLPSVFLVFLYNSQSITVSHSTLVNTHIAINPEPQLSLHPSFPPTPPPSVFLYNSQSITVSQSTFLNNRVAIDLNRNFGILILACTFIGRTVCSSHSTFLNNRVAIDLNRNFGILILTCTFIGGTTCSKSSGGSTPYDAASTHLMPPTPPQLLPSTHALMPSTHAPTPLMPSTHAPTPLMPSTQATPQLPAGAASSSLHIEAATNEDEMEGYTTSNWQSPGLMLTAPQYSMEDDYNEDEYSETAEAATKGVMGRGGKWGWRKRRVRGESNGSTYNADEGDDEGVGESTAKILSTYLKDGSAYNEDQLVYNDDETAYNGSEDGHEVDEEEVEDEEEEEEDDGGGEIEAVQRVKEMATRGRVAAGFFYSRDGGTFKSPIGVMLSQVKLSGMLEANRVVNSR